MSSKNIRLVVVLGAFSIIGILSAQIYWIMRTYDLQERQFQYSVESALIRVAENIGEYNGSVLPTKDLITRQASNYYVVNINDVIDANILEYYLQKEFEVSALNTDFEYGIYDCASDRMLYGNYISSDDKQNDNPRTELPKYDEFNYYFGVRFPKITARIISNMLLVVIFSVILMFAISFFVYALSVILRQKRLSEMQKDFINNMTHEFKTPISTIAISSNVFIKDRYVQENPRLKKYATLIKEQAARLTNQVEKVLQIVKVENDSFRLNKEDIHLNELLQSIGRQYEIKIENSDGKIELILPEASYELSADRMHLENIIENLLDNSLKYADVHPLYLRLSFQRKSGFFELKVSDNGKGIPPEYHQKVFEKFFRVPTGDLHNVKGFGLGLFYVRNICSSHGWTLNMESSPSSGTTFSIAIPTSQVKAIKKTESVI